MVLAKGCRVSRCGVVPLPAVAGWPWCDLTRTRQMPWTAVGQRDSGERASGQGDVRSSTEGGDSRPRDRSGPVHVRLQAGVRLWKGVPYEVHHS